PARPRALPAVPADKGYEAALGAVPSGPPAPERARVTSSPAPQQAAPQPAASVCAAAGRARVAQVAPVTKTASAGRALVGMNQRGAAQAEAEVEAARARPAPVGQGRPALGRAARRAALREARGTERRREQDRNGRAGQLWSCSGLRGGPAR
ncbi:MAG TPA: hypothetical protein VEJ84_17255, partial [Acidimicrobiales bacterium]|nr:hypothetical protein [Acidimicrobiales bacterium]